MSKTRKQYETSVAVLRDDPRGTLVEKRYDECPGRPNPYMLAAFDHSCSYDDAESVGAVMSRLAAEHLGYLTCHTTAGCMEFSIHISRDIDELDAPASVQQGGRVNAEREHCEAVAKAWLGDLAMEPCPVCGLEHDRRNPECPPGYVGELADLIARERADLLARIALLDSALRDVVDATVGIDGRVAVAVHRAEAVLRGGT